MKGTVFPIWGLLTVFLVFFWAALMSLVVLGAVLPLSLVFSHSCSTNVSCLLTRIFFCPILSSSVKLGDVMFTPPMMSQMISEVNCEVVLLCCTVGAEEWQVLGKHLLSLIQPLHGSFWCLSGVTWDDYAHSSLASSSPERVWSYLISAKSPGIDHDVTNQRSFSPSGNKLKRRRMSMTS